MFAEAASPSKSAQSSGAAVVPSNQASTTECYSAVWSSSEATGATNPITSHTGAEIKPSTANAPSLNKKSPPKKAYASPFTKGTSKGGGPKRKRRYCKTPGCQRIVKSQGVCQRHGAKTRKCKIATCSKHAQGAYDGLCKAHFKEIHGDGAVEDDTPPSVAVVTTVATTTMAVPAPQLPRAQHRRQVTPIWGPPVLDLPIEDPVTESCPPIEDPVTESCPPIEDPVTESVYVQIISASFVWKENSATSMPLVSHLQQGFEEAKPPAWHRNDERKARGMLQVSDPTQDLEDWERELVMTEALLLKGNTHSASFELQFASAWGRNPGFHTDLVRSMCLQRINAKPVAPPAISTINDSPKRAYSGAVLHEPDIVEELVPVAENTKLPPQIEDIGLADEEEHLQLLHAAATSTTASSSIVKDEEPVIPMLSVFDTEVSIAGTDVPVDPKDDDHNILNDDNFGAALYNDSLEADMLVLAASGESSNNNNTVASFGNKFEEFMFGPLSMESYCEAIPGTDAVQGVPTSCNS